MTGTHQGYKFLSRSARTNLPCRGYIAVFKHPYFAVTNKDGASDLKNVPPGKYTNEAWHEKVWVLTQKVTIAPNQTKLWSLFSSDEVDLETMQVPA